MTTRFQIRDLTPERIAQAYPVVREITHDLSLDGWSAFAQSLIEEEPRAAWPSGIVVADLDGYIRGLFTYHVTPTLDHGRTLVVRNFAVLQMIRREALADTMLGAVNDLAQDHECQAIHAHIPAASAWTIDYFTGNGHTVEKHVLCKTAARGP